MTRARAPQPAASFPPEFAQLWHHVHNTGQKITIDNLGNEKGRYTSFRARMNAWRKANYDEAMESGDENRILIAHGLYSVAISNPYQEGGQWKCDVRQRDGALGNKITEKIGKWTEPVEEREKEAPAPEPKQAPKPSAADKIGQLYRSGEE